MGAGLPGTQLQGTLPIINCMGMRKPGLVKNSGLSGGDYSGFNIIGEVQFLS